MTARLEYAVFDGATLPAELELELGGLQVAVVSSLGSPRTAVSTVAVRSGRARFEALFWGPDGVLSGAAAVGLVEAGYSASSRVGSSASSVAYWPGEGQIRSDGTLIATVAKAQLGDVIGVELDLVSVSPTLSFSLNGIVLYSGGYALPGSPSEAFAAVSVAGGVGDLRAFCNFGQRAFEHPPVAGVEVLGFFQQRAAAELLRFASETYTTQPTDTPANTTYEGRIRQGAAFEVARAVSFWPWGNSGAGSSLGQLEIIDPNDEYAALFSDDYRDQPVRLLLVEPGAPLSSAVVVAEGLLERVEATEDAKRVFLSPKSKLLEVPLQRRLFLPNAVESAANGPRPVLIGAARQLEPVLFDEFGQRYAVSDTAVQTIAVVRDRGDPLEIVGSPGDWSYLPDSSGVDLNAEPVGKLTVDASSSTGAGAPVIVDLLGGIGNPFVPDGGSPADEEPVGWTTTESNTGIVRTVDVVGGGLRLFRASSSPAAGTYPAATVAGSPSPCVPGRGYRLRFSITQYEPQTIQPDTHGLEVRHGLNGTLIGRAQSVGAFLFTFVATGSDLTLQLGQRFQGTAGAQTIVVEGLTLEDAEDAALAQASAALPAVPLVTLARDIIEARAGLDTADWSSASAEAADPLGHGAGFFTRGAATCKQALDALLVSYAAALFESPDGVLSFARLEDPVARLAGSPTVEPDWVFGPSQILDPGYSVRVDTAQNLTTAALCRRNWTQLSPSELVTDQLDVPPAARALFGKRYQAARYAATPVGSSYRHAVGASPVELLFDEPDDAQAEIERIAALYSLQGWRRFISFSVPWSDAEEFLAQPGDIVRLDHAAAGVEAGTLALVYSVRADVFRQTVAFGVWA